MTLPNALVLVITITALITLVVLLVRWSSRQQAQRNAKVRESDAALREVARVLGLSFREGGSYNHPLQGPYASFGSVAGEVDGVTVRIEVTFDSAGSGTVEFTTEIGVQCQTRIEPALPTDFEAVFEDGWVRVSRRGSLWARGETFGVVTDAGVLLDLTRKLADQVRRNGAGVRV
jgi:hypothetical protein